MRLRFSEEEIKWANERKKVGGRERERENESKLELVLNWNDEFQKDSQANKSTRISPSEGGWITQGHPLSCTQAMLSLLSLSGIPSLHMWVTFDYLKPYQLASLLNDSLPQMTGWEFPCSTHKGPSNTMLCGDDLKCKNSLDLILNDQYHFFFSTNSA